MWRFNTRDTKPKLYSLLFITALAALALGVQLVLDPRGNAGAACVTVAVYCLFAVVLLLYSFREQIRYNPYSYNTIIYFGFALFTLSVMITHILLAVRTFRQPEVYTGEQILHTLLGSAKNYILISAPFILSFSAALCVSNLVLLRREGRSFANLLGILLSLLLVAGAAFLFLFDYEVSGSQREVMVHDLVTNLLAAVYLYFECMIIGTVAADVIAARYEPEPDMDWLIVLGCGLKKDGTPTPILMGRIRRAAEFYRRQTEQTCKPLRIVASGGQGPDEAVAESTAIRRVLVALGVPEEQILEEDRSTSTLENMQFSKALIEERGPMGKVAFSTTNYHVFRSGL